MKKTLVALFTLIGLALSIQVTQAACPCASPCPVAAPCCPATPVATPCCPTVTCDPCAKSCDPCCKPKCKCTWWKIFENKCCCAKCNGSCNCPNTAKRCYWWKFWEDRCVVPNPNYNNNDCGCGCS